MMAGLNMTQEECRKAVFPDMNASRFSFILNEERRAAELAKLELWLSTAYTAKINQEASDVR
jgi:hypothetical protein